MPSFRTRLAEVVEKAFDRNQRSLARAIGRVAEGLPRDRASLSDAAHATTYSPYVNRWLKGGQPNHEQLALLCMATGRSADWWLFGDGARFGAERLPPEGRPAASSAVLEKAVYEGLFRTVPLQAHLTFEYRFLAVVAMKLAMATGARSVRGYRTAGRLLGRCLGAPLQILGVKLTPQDQQIAQAYISAAAHAVEMLAPYARPTA